MNPYSPRCSAVSLPILIGVSIVLGAAVDARAHTWEWAVTPLFVWGKNLEGTSAVGGNELPLDLDFQDDILENLDASLSFRVEAVKDRVAWFAEYNFARLEPRAEASLGPVTLNAEVEYEDIMAEAGFAWTLSDTGVGQWETLAGVRYFDQDVVVEIGRDQQTGDTTALQTVNGGDSWWHGFVGMRYSHAFSDRWSARVRADVGYGGADNSAMHALGFFNYRFADWGSAFLGYRFLSVDYDNEGTDASAFDYAVDQQGPLVGLSIHF